MKCCISVGPESDINTIGQHAMQLHGVWGCHPVIASKTGAGMRNHRDYTFISVYTQLFRLTNIVELGGIVHALHWFATIINHFKTILSHYKCNCKADILISHCFHAFSGCWIIGFPSIAKTRVGHYYFEHNCQIRQELQTQIINLLF